MTWTETRNHFNGLSYADKLKWWESNVPKNETGDYQFPFNYSGEGAPEVHTILNSLNGSSRPIRKLEFITIIPEQQEIEDFLQWLLPQMEKTFFLTIENHVSEINKRYARVAPILRKEGVEREYQTIRNQIEGLSAFVKAGYEYGTNHVCDFVQFVKPNTFNDKNFDFLLKSFIGGMSIANKFGAITSIRAGINEIKAQEPRKSKEGQWSQAHAVIVFHYLLEALGAIQDKSRRAAFTGLITGFSTEQIRKATSGSSEMFYTKYAKKREKEINTIIEQLNNLELFAIADKIKSDTATLT